MEGPLENISGDYELNPLWDSAADYESTELKLLQEETEIPMKPMEKVKAAFKSPVVRKIAMILLLSAVTAVGAALFIAGCMTVNPILAAPGLALLAIGLCSLCGVDGLFQAFVMPSANTMDYGYALNSQYLIDGQEWLSAQHDDRMDDYFGT